MEPLTVSPSFDKSLVLKLFHIFFLYSGTRLTGGHQGGHAKVSVLSGLLEKTSQTHVLSIQRLKQTFLWQQNALRLLTVTVTSSN